MDIDATLNKLDSLCSRLEVALLQLQAAPTRRNPYAAFRETHENAGKPWRREDDEELQRFYTNAQRHSRSVNEARLARGAAYRCGLGPAT